MTSTVRRLRRKLLGISVAETSFARRGFRGGEAAVRDRLERIGRTFLQGYHAALEEGRPEALGYHLDGVDAEFRGFAFEGAAMALALLDHMMPQRGNRVAGFLGGPGADHLYMVHVGVGWALARLPWLRGDPRRCLARLDPLLRWLALDGYGFHEGYFSWRRFVEREAVPVHLSGYAPRAFDQGLGRSLWFVDGSDAGRIAATVAAFAPERRADLWSGVGLACAYAGGADRSAIETLREAAGPHRPHLAQGAAFAAKARQRACNPQDHTDCACGVLCGMSADEAAVVTDGGAGGPAARRGDAGLRGVALAYPVSFHRGECEMMASASAMIRRHAARLVAAAIILVLYAMARLPAASRTELTDLAARFRFARQPLPEWPGTPRRTLRPVHPSLERIAPWISSVGAAVALNDVDGDGLPNDVCLVDPRSDRVFVAPVPGTGRRFAPFALDPSPLDYDPRTMAPMGCLPGDFNEDGQTDLLIYYWGRTPVVFLRREGATGDDGLAGEDFRRQELVPAGARWYTNAMTQADVDGDGHVDLVLGNYFADDARILDARAFGVESMQRSMSRAFNGGSKRVFLWAGASPGAYPSADFREAEGAFEETVIHGWPLAVGAADLDGDLLPEIYFANDFGPDRLLHNRSKPGGPWLALLEGRKTLTIPSSKVLGRDSFKGMGVDFGDLNGDGLPDIYVSNIAAEFALLESHFAFVSTGETALMREGVAPYVDRSEPLGLSRSGWAWESRLGDFDNDGELEALQAVGFVRGAVDRWAELQELAMGNDELLSDPTSWPRFATGDDLSGHLRNPFFARERPNGRFRDVAAELGLDEPGVSRGIATADVDGDGRLDMAVANQWASSSFRHNESPGVGSFLGLHLRIPLREGPTRARAGHPGADSPGRPAIGAEATVFLADGRRLVAQVDGGNGHSGKRSPDIHFGLGRISPETSLKISLRWREPGGRVRSEELTLAPGWHTVQLGRGHDATTSVTEAQGR